MKVKAVKPISFLFFRAETKITELPRFIPIGQELFKEAVLHRLTITGPVHWHYIGFNGNPDQNFILEIALPVGEIEGDYDGKFHFKRSESFKCVSLEHDGDWTEIPKSYAKIFQFITEHGLKPVAVNREIYVNVDFKTPQANTTEIQIGIQ